MLSGTMLRKFGAVIGDCAGCSVELLGTQLDVQWSYRGMCFEVRYSYLELCLVHCAFIGNCA